MKKQAVNRSFCLVAVSLIFTFLSLGSTIAILVLQITNNQLALFSQVNTSYITGWADIQTSCGLYSTYSALKYYCTKYQSHLSFLQVTNALLIAIIVILFMIGSFITVLLVNVKRNTHDCMSQVSTKKTVLGLLSLDMIAGFSLLGYYISFYMQFDNLTILSTSVSDYRSTFFIGLVIGCAASVFSLVNYIVVFIVKAAIKVENKYQAANQKQNTLNTTVGNQKTERQPNTSHVRKQNSPMKMKERQNFYNEMHQQNNKIGKNKSQIDIEEVRVEEEEQGTDFKSHEKRTTNGITRERPKLPTKTEVRTGSYPKLQKPFFYTGKKKKLTTQDQQLLKQAKDEQINKIQNQLEVYESTLQKENENDENKNGKQNSIADANKGGDGKEIEMVNLRLNTNFGSQGEVSNMDPTRLFVFERTLGFTEHLKMKERKDRYKLQ